MRAEIAQLVEQRHGKAQVVGSIPTLGSRIKQVSIFPILARLERSSSHGFNAIPRASRVWRIRLNLEIFGEIFGFSGSIKM